MSALNSLAIDTHFTDALPGDPDTANVRRQVAGACFSKVAPTPVRAPQLVAWSPEVAQWIGISDEECRSERFLRVFSGNELLPGMEPYAMCYGGHQFGNWAGQLGDGRAINLGDVINPQGQRLTLQLKGAGPTPYSRTADGLAVLRSSLREFLCSEAMHHLGVPTTRALSLMLTGEEVMRDILYDGHPKNEPGAVVCRVAPSFLRFGNYQLFAMRKELDEQKQLLDFTINTYFPHLGEPGPDTYVAWFNEVCQRTAELMVHWMRVGFVHGVMNTDNLSILGLTIDYGPYGWVEDFDPDWTPNTTDAGSRRYRFSHQPHIGQWNLLQLANAIYPQVGDAAPLEAALTEYARSYERLWQLMMNQKLGFDSYRPGTDEPLQADLLNLLTTVETDMPLFYRGLAAMDLEQDLDRSAGIPQALREAYYQDDQLTADYAGKLHDWLHAYQSQSRQRNLADQPRRALMNRTNPKYVLRNYLAQLAIDKAEAGDFSMVHELLDTLRRPYDEQPERSGFAARRPEWARHRAGCSMLSCSS